MHDWLTGMRGGERVLEALCGLLGEADILTLIHTPGSTCGAIEHRRIVTSFLNDLPGAGRYYRWLLPLMPAAAEAIDAAAYDVLIASSHCVANGVGRRRAGQLHVCYCHSPMRYAWSALGDYAAGAGPLRGAALRAMAPLLRAWDRRMAGRVDAFIANSAAVADRIGRFYGRPAAVLHPPVDADYFTPDYGSREEFYLAVSHRAPYKRMEQAIEAAAMAGRRLKVVGEPPMGGRWRRVAGAGLEMLGWVGRAELRGLYRRCRALLMPGEEDFGIAAVEAMSCGAPVIALAAGGALETVRDAAAEVDNPTGLLYRRPTAAGLADVIGAFERLGERFDAAAMHQWARRFGPERFAAGFAAHVGPLLRQRGFAEPWSSNTTS
ncbi:MAG: glycosyltransferase [Planctomycetota bacterium]